MTPEEAMSEMHAVHAHRRGGPERLLYGYAPVPRLQPGEVLVAVHSASITRGELQWPATWTTAFDDSGEPRTPIIPSKEVSGTVDQLGPATSRFRVGDDVYGLIPFLRDGAAAEFVAVPEKVLAPKPPSLDHDQCAALPLAGLTAWQGLVRHAGLRAGQRVLVHGGAGGVGSLVVQVAAALGAAVTATATGADLDFVRGLGAERVVDYTSRPFEEEVRDVDVVFDTVGGDTAARSWRVLRPGGTLVSIVAPPPPPPGPESRAVFFVVEPDQAGLGELTALVESGRLTPRVDRVVPLQHTAEAYAALEQEHHQGKIVLHIA
ncbi:NADP-dependent oxidoreductase [Streptomyces sp. MUM 136J]|nr:NADP-dependent oxidoreductase [Streptomyces sp. MUM 2J]MCH0570573.1 NADP-dependent oxidoreductase [Streptomyces sp. MUM 136J]